MEKLYSIREAARIVELTSEALRHYDRIGLVSPSHRDAQTGYRYYTRAELIRLSTIRALRGMDVPLEEIKRALDMDSLEAVIAFFNRAERRADEKLARLQYAKRKIRQARAEYEKKLEPPRAGDDAFEQYFPKRVILLSDRLREPELDNLWCYHKSFYDQLEPEQRERFAFEDLAGIYHSGGQSRLFAVCLSHVPRPDVIELPAGEYLCLDCVEEDRRDAMARLMGASEARGGGRAGFALELVVVSGILQWNYQVQVYIADAARRCDMRD